MQRVAFSRLKRNLFILCFFFIGFTLGLHYWQIIIQNSCPSSSYSPTPIKVQSSFYDHFRYRTIKTCQNESSNIFLTIAVLSSYERLSLYLPAILETWVLTATIEIEIIIFLEENFTGTEEFIQKIFSQLNKKQNQKIQSCLFIVKLKHVENNYPPQKKSFYAMKFIYTYYRQRTSWVLRLDDNAYVNIQELTKWLKSIDYQQALYIGQGGTGRRNGPAIHFQPGQYFCMGGSGIILSRQTLIQLGPWLDRCFDTELRTNHEDVELGRCIITHVHISCTNAYDSKYLFYHHYGPYYLFGNDFTSSIISRAFILHPIKNQTTFRQIYHFYLRKKRMKFQSSLTIRSNKESYTTFLTSIEFDLTRDIHYQLIDTRWRSYIDETVQSYVVHLQKLWHQRSSNWTLINGKFLLGYHRMTPTYDLELIVEILLNVRSVFISPPRSSIIRKRFHIRQPFISKRHLEYREIINIDSNDEDDRLNLVVVSSNKDEALKRFVHNFQSEILDTPNRHRYFTLTIVYFSKNYSIIDSIRQLSVRYPLIIRISIINETLYSYNRGLGRQLASQLFEKTQLIFFLDVDLIFTEKALMNTRRLIIHQLSISSCAVYFPIVYSIFSNKFIVDNRSMIDVTSKFGSFSIYGFGNVVLRKGDLDRIGGWEINNHDWGVEDVHLFQRFVNISSECIIFRAVEPGLKHYYHKKMCDGIQNKVRQKMCYDAETNLLGSQVDMVDYIFQNKIVNN